MAYKPVAPVQHTAGDLEVLSHWTFTKDAFGDWRGVHANGTLRTRLKFSMQSAQHDALIGRLQRCVRGVWEDTIDRFDRQHRTS